MMRYRELPHTGGREGHPLYVLDRCWAIFEVDGDDLWWWEGAGNWGDTWDDLLVGTLSVIGDQLHRMRAKRPDAAGLHLINLSDLARHRGFQGKVGLPAKVNSRPGLAALEDLSARWQAQRPAIGSNG